ncbi:hypothetical protein [Acinetobacter pittii]|uniref:hypothetical protein n=1 Tax=Acinetobacter pittii TaxID=48296 RepID=UPI0009937D48|nr:hypothetical protein [Acinetobacter pittii]AQV16893.1 hypothetical protein BMU11_15365 [Acinetobacter pittii]OON26530.1 hypothetical protein BI372_01865 [Acinetobacter pittii]
MKVVFLKFIEFYQNLWSFRNIVYLLTLSFFVFLILLFTLPLGADNTLHWGNLHINFESINLGELGGFLSGIFAPLAFLWLMLNMKQQDKNLEIAEKQLSILLQEKENRRKALKATIKNTSVTYENNPFPDENDYDDFIISFKSDIKLIDCYLKPFSKASPFIYMAARRTNQIFITTSKKNIDIDEEFSIMVKVKISSIDTLNQQVNDRIKLIYLDQEGYEQSNEILFLYSVTNLENSTPKKRGILFALPT